MSDEDGFLQKLRDNPADDTTRLVYADWLGERGDPVSGAKAHFLRLTVRSRDHYLARREDRKLQKLAAKLDTDWLAVVSRLTVENCRRHPSSPRDQSELARELFAFLCDQHWEEMTPTGDDRVRMCDRCEEAVHYCDTIVTARLHARQGHCVAVDLGIIRSRADENSFQPLELARGMMHVDALEPREPPIDAVSQAREDAKRKQRGDAEGNG